jgi:hypothetical protein
MDGLGLLISLVATAGAFCGGKAATMRTGAGPWLLATFGLAALGLLLLAVSEGAR